MMKSSFVVAAFACCCMFLAGCGETCQKRDNAFTHGLKDDTSQCDSTKKCDGIRKCDGKKCEKDKCDGKCVNAAPKCDKPKAGKDACPSTKAADCCGTCGGKAGHAHGAGTHTHGKAGNCCGTCGGKGKPANAGKATSGGYFTITDLKSDG